jgi:hypothetical protein
VSSRAVGSEVVQAVRLSPAAGGVFERLRNARKRPLAEARELYALVDAGMSVEDVAALFEASLGADYAAELGVCPAIVHVKYRLCQWELAPQYGFRAG